MVSSLAAPGQIHPALGLLFAFPIALFPAGLLADAAYLGSAEMQWSNMASWAITAALVVGAPALAWSAFAAVRRRVAWPGPLLLGLALLAGFVNAFHHSQDAWASVGVGGLLLSLVSSVAVLAAGWFAFAGRRVRMEAVR